MNKHKCKSDYLLFSVLGLQHKAAHKKTKAVAAEGLKRERKMSSTRCRYMIDENVSSTDEIEGIAVFTAVFIPTCITTNQY